MKYLSLFSGIEAATVAWHPLGWECVGVSEIEPFPCAVLAHHYPNVPNLGDVTKITEQDIAALGPIDLVVFGSPCQDLSVAGHRKGLINADGTVTRSGLFFTAINIFQWAHKHCGARFALWENVPGAYSSNNGRDFAAVVEFMAGLDECPIPPKGWGTEGVAVGDNGLLEWACLDAQWFGVAQRRRRVFALLDTGDWAGRPPILLEPESLRGDSAPSREAREEVAGGSIPSVAGSLDTECGGGKLTHQSINSGHVIGTITARMFNALGARDVEEGALLPVTHTMRGEGFNASEDGTGRRTPLVPVAFHPTQDPISNTDGSTHAMGCGSKGGCSTVAVALQATYGIPGNWIGRKPENGGNAVQPMYDIAPNLTSSDRHGVAQSTQVRRLTPVECERLQGFPDNYTDIKPKGKPTPDGPRYKALGNSMAVPVMAWIGRQIEEVIK